MSDPAREERSARTVEQRQSGRTEVRFPDGASGEFEALVLPYGVVDTYGTVWEPGVFSDSLGRRMPVLVWGHDWHEPIGRATAWREVREGPAAGLYMTFRLSNPDVVTRAAQAYEQLRDGTLDNFSVGFIREEQRDASEEYGPGVVAITRAQLDEVSIVIVGAVHGTRLLSVREQRRSMVVPMDEAERLLLALYAGEADLADTLGQLKGLATDGPASDPVDPDGEVAEVEAPESDPEVEVEVEVAEVPADDEESSEVAEVPAEPERLDDETEAALVEQIDDALAAVETLPW
jgi:HK97 family phage prohead protease